jgi:predicted nucleotidyltransferase
MEGADARFLRGWSRRRELEREAAAAWRRERLTECRAMSSALLELPGVRRVALFGSLARGEAAPGSDVDVWIEGLAESEWLSAVAVARRMVSAAEVDLVRAESASPALAARVAAEGQVLGER